MAKYIDFVTQPCTVHETQKKLDELSKDLDRETFTVSYDINIAGMSAKTAGYTVNGQLIPAFDPEVNQGFFDLDFGDDEVTEPGVGPQEPPVETKEHSLPVTKSRGVLFPKFCRVDNILGCFFCNNPTDFIYCRSKVDDTRCCLDCVSHLGYRMGPDNWPMKIKED